MEPSPVEHRSHAREYCTRCSCFSHSHTRKGTPSLRSTRLAKMRPRRPLPSAKGCTWKRPISTAAAFVCGARSTRATCYTCVTPKVTLVSLVCRILMDAACT
eukprot:7424854-Pyramimonas_sp.AAC.1